MQRLAAWLDGHRAAPSWLSSLALGALGVAAVVALGLLLKTRTGGSEPLMAVFPILMVVCLGWGGLAGWVTLFGGILGAWYVYLGQQFSFLIPVEDVRALAIAFVVGSLIIGLCELLKGSNSRLQAANTASQALARGLTAQTDHIFELNASLSQALEARMRAQAAQALSEEHIRASFEGAPVGKTHSDPISGRILRVNRSFADMLGYEPDELIGRMGWDFTPDEDRDAERAAFQLVLDGRKAAYISEKRYLRRDGQTVLGRVSATVTRSPETGAPILAVSVIENIDGQYKAKVALEAAKRSFEALLDERTATLAQRDVLLREVYHRVKNNLQIVDSLLVLQRGRLTDPEARAALSALRDRVYALGLVHHQLMGSKDLKTFDIAPFLKELSANLVRGGAPRGLSLSVRSLPLKVGLDFAIPLGLVVTELVTNSLKHAFPLGAGAINVTLELAPNGMVTLSVSDDSAAMEANDAARPNRSSMGLTIVEALVRQLHGVMTIQRDCGYRTEIQVPQPVTP